MTLITFEQLRPIVHQHESEKSTEEWDKLGSDFLDGKTVIIH